MNPLDKPRAKIRRVADQLVALDMTVQAFFERNPYRIVTAEFNPKTGGNILRLQAELPQLPDEKWSVLVGEIGHNIRSALDNLVCQLSRINDPAINCSDTGFVTFLNGPRATAPERFRWKSKRLAKLTRSERARIERAQPYKRGNGGQSNALWHLHELNNIDKHGIGLAAASGSRMIGVLVKPPDGYMRGPTRFKNPKGRLKANAKIGYIGDHMDVDLWLVPNLVFDQMGKPLDGLPVLPSLLEMAQAAHKVIESFAGE